MNNLRAAVTNIIDGEGASDWFVGEEVSENGITVKCIRRFGGREKFYLAWEVQDENSGITYWRIDGFYDSYGCACADISDLKQVQKVERMVTFYE